MSEFDAIIGYDATKQELKRIADTLKNTKHYETFGVEAPRGLVLYGPAGTGKTLMADCVVKASGRPAYVCRRNESDDTFIDKLAHALAEKSYLTAKETAELKQGLVLVAPEA